MDEKSSFLDGIASIIALLVCGPIFFGPAVLCWQVFQWLKTGEWYPVPVSKILDWNQLRYPDLEWRGLQKIVDYLFGLPLSFVSFIAAVGIFATVLAIIDHVQHNRSRR